MDSTDLEYTSAVDKHRQADKTSRASPKSHSPYPSSGTSSPSVNPARRSSGDLLATPRTATSTSATGFSPLYLGSNLAPAVSKLRRTSQFFSKWTNSLVKAPSGKSSQRRERVPPTRSFSSHYASDSPLSVTDDLTEGEPVMYARARSEYEPTLSHSVSDLPPDLRRDSMYSVRTSATAPVGNRSSTDSPNGLQRENSTSTSVDKESPEFLSALKSFQLQTEADPNGDLQQLRDALHNFSVTDSNRKRSSSTHQTTDTSESELEADLIQGHSRSGPLPRHSNHTIPSLPEISTDQASGSEVCPIDDQSTLGDLSPSTRAHRLFSNPSQLLPTTEVAEYLGRRGSEPAAIRAAYMDHFSFARQRLDEAFRTMCTHLYLRGETQVIDRILADFARRYWDCNPDSVFGSQDVVYAVSYSLLLLNTDLHVARNHSKMTRGEFVRNTMSAVDSCVKEASQDSASGSSEAPSRPFNRDEISSTLKDIYSGIKQQQILQHIEPRSSIGRRASSASSPGSTLTQDSLHRTHSFTRLNINGGKQSTPWELSRQKSGNSLNQSSSHSTRGRRSETPDLFFNSSKTPKHQPPAENALVNPTEAAVYPYTKTGLLVRKHLYERTDKKAPNRTWKDCLISVEGGELRMYKADRHSRDPSDSKSPPIDPSLLLGTVTLRHCLAVTLPPPGYSSSRPHVFALQLPSGGVYLFQAAAADYVSAWVVVCNFWAARESKEPLPGGITSIDYGWGTEYGGHDGRTVLPELDEESEDSSNVLPASDSNLPISSRQLFNEPSSQPKMSPAIQEWRPPALPMVCSTLDEDAQLGALLRQISSLDNELVEHMELRGSIHRRMPPRSPHYAKAFSNWERKSQYLLRELIKYQTYADVLKRTLAANRGLTNIDDVLDVPEVEDVTEFIPGDLRELDEISERAHEEAPSVASEKPLEASDESLGQPSGDVFETPQDESPDHPSATTDS